MMQAKWTVAYGLVSRAHYPLPAIAETLRDDAVKAHGKLPGFVGSVSSYMFPGHVGGTVCMYGMYVGRYWRNNARRRNGASS